jgi:hypothetical protein
MCVREEKIIVFHGINVLLPSEAPFKITGIITKLGLLDYTSAVLRY